MGVGSVPSDEDSSLQRVTNLDHFGAFDNRTCTDIQSNMGIGSSIHPCWDFDETVTTFMFEQ
jgi:hypothetical protein